MSGDGDSPNVLLVHCHDLGRQLGCYGSDVETPRINSLAADGVRFTDYFCTAPQCSPSRASILTGRHPHRVGMLGLAHLGWGIDPGTPALPGLLADAGYRTRQFGLQHVARGEGATLDELGFDAVDDADSNRATDVADRVAQYLGDRASDDAPFFASVGFSEPHRIGGGFEGERYDRRDPWTVEPLPYLPDLEGIRDDLAGFHGLVEAVDDAVGRVLDALDDAGLADETLVVFTTDHGEAFPRAKGTLYDAGLGTALVMRHPSFEGGARDELLSNVDLLPTLCDLAGADVPGNVDGRTFRSLLDGEGAFDPRERVFAGMAYHDRLCPMRGVRTDRYKYVRNLAENLPRVYLPSDVRDSRAGQALYREWYVPDRPEEELYDLDADPHERENLADDPAHREVLERLRADLGEWRERTDDPLLDGIPPVPDVHAERLRWPRG